VVKQTLADARIMVIDDDPALLNFTCKYLARLGYSVVPYGSAEEAWRQFESPAADYSLAVVDLSLPGLSGEQLCGMMLRSKPDVRLILMSGYPIDPQKLFEAGRDRMAFLQKPFTPTMLAETVNRMLSDPSGSDAD
jgi:two-component system, cell cycle sensor histidine kinase and response regulator CckA